MLERFETNALSQAIGIANRQHDVALVNQSTYLSTGRCEATDVQNTRFFHARTFTEIALETIQKSTMHNFRSRIR